MTKITRFLALLLTLVMLFCSCDIGFNTPVTEETTISVTESNTESELETTESESKSESASESESETETTTGSTEPIIDSLTQKRLEYSILKSDILQKYSLTQEDIDNAKQILNDCIYAAMASDKEKIDELSDKFDEAYYHISTQSTIATIIYYCDTSDDDASANYDFAHDAYTDLYDVYIEAMRKMYKESPIADYIFADWSQEDIDYLLAYSDEESALRDANNDIVIQYNDLPQSAFKDQTALLYAQLVTNNDKIAELNGYDSYYDYAAKNVYGRDYTAEDLDAFHELVAQKIALRINGFYNKWYVKYSKFNRTQQRNLINFLYEGFDTLDKNYVFDYIASCNDTMGEGLNHAFANKNIIFANSKNSHQSAFQVYLEEPEHPFCLFGSDGQSSMTVVHELGHYYSSLHNPDIGSYDIAETQSQANEYLLLQYISDKMDKDIYSVVLDYSIYNGLVTVMIATIIDEFEQEVYALESVEGYTSADFDAIMDKVCEKYGGIDFINQNVTNMYDYWRYVVIESPVYYISYATSQMAALNIYAIAKNDYEGARAIYREIVEVEEAEMEEDFIEMLNRVGLSNPFEAEGFNAIILGATGK
jgi:hypothetical protein